MGWQDRYGLGGGGDGFGDVSGGSTSSAPTLSADGWEDVSPAVQRRRKPDGSYEYRPAAQFAGAELGVGPVEDPYHGVTAFDALREQVRARIKGGADFLAHLPGEIAGQFLKDPMGFGSMGPAVDAKGDEVTSAVDSALIPPIVESTFQSARDERARAQDKLLQHAIATGASPEVAAFGDTTADAAGQVLDPTNLLMGGEISKLAGLTEKSLPGWAARFGRGAPKEVAEALAAHLDPDASYLARRAKIMPMVPGVEEPLFGPGAIRDAMKPESELLAVGTHKTDLSRDVALGLRAPTAAEPALQELQRASLAIDHEATAGRLMAGEPVHAGELASFHDLQRAAVQRSVDAGQWVPPPLLDANPDLAAQVAVGSPAERGFVRIPTPKFLSKYFTKDGAFEAMGSLKGWAFERTAQMRHQYAAGERLTGQNLRDFTTAFADTVRATGAKPDDLLEYVRAGIQGQNDLSGVPPALRFAVDGMREHLDTLSEGYLSRTDLPQALRDTIEQNKGSYLPRTFRVFEQPDWTSIVDPASPRADPREAWRWVSYKSWAEGQRTADATQIYVGGKVTLPDGSQGHVVRVGASTKEALAAATARPEYQSFPVPPGPQGTASGAVSAAVAPQRDEILQRFHSGEIDWPTARQEFKQARNVASPQVWAERSQQTQARLDALEQRRQLRMQFFEEEKAARQGQVLVQTGVDPQTLEPIRQALTRDQLRGVGGMAQWTDEEITAYGQRLLNRDPDAFLSVARPVTGRENGGNLISRIRQDPTIDHLPTDLAQKVQAGEMSLPGAIDQAKARPGWFAEYLQHAEGLPHQIDSLLGLEKDPSVAYRAGALRAIHDQAIYSLHKDLAEAGKGTIFYDQAPGAPGYFQQIGGRGPLAGMYTSPEIAGIVRGTENTSRAASGWLAGWQKINGLVKLGKTTANFPGGHMRNLLAWPFQLMAGGHFTAAFNPAGAVRLLPFQVADKLGTQRGWVTKLFKGMADTIELADGSRLGEKLSGDLKELRPEINFLYEKGVFGESPHAEDLRHYTGAVFRERAYNEPPAVGRVRRAGRAVADVARSGADVGTNFWAGGDDLGKHLVYRAELHNLLWANNKLGAFEKLPADYFARPEFAQEAEEAAARVRATTPTASNVAPAVKALRDAPIAPFPGWTAEVFRNAKEQVKLGISDLRSPNPRMQALGMKRLSGFMATAGLAGGAVGKAFSAASGVKVPDAIRSFVAPWSRDSQVAVTDLDPKTGRARYVDLSSLMPYAAFMDSAAILLHAIQDKATDKWDSAIDGAESLLRPFIEEDIGVSAAVDWLRNKRSEGGPVQNVLNMARHHEQRQQDYPVYTPGASGMTQAKQTLYHFWRQLGPAGIVGLQGERIARAAFNDNPEVRGAFATLTNYDRDLNLRDETMGALGLRFSTVDVAGSLKRQAADYGRDREDAKALYKRRAKISMDGQIRPADIKVILAAKEEANQMGRASHEQMAQVVADALRLGMPAWRVRQWLTKSEIGGVYINRLIQDANRLNQGQEVNGFIPVVR